VVESGVPLVVIFGWRSEEWFGVLRVGTGTVLFEVESEELYEC
jgi:hypothetical protein